MNTTRTTHLLAALLSGAAFAIAVPAWAQQTPAMIEGAQPESPVNPLAETPDSGTMMRADKEDKGSAAAQKANAKADKEGEKNPRKSSAAQAELGKKGGKTKK